MFKDFTDNLKGIQTSGALPLTGSRAEILIIRLR